MTLSNERYHLFPQLGVVLLACVALRPWLRRFDTSALAGLTIAACLLFLHLGAIRATAKTYRFPDQAKTLVAIETLAQVGRDRGITRDQILGAIDPVRTRWFNTDWNALMMLPIAADASRVPNDQVRSVLLGSLSSADREGLCGGMNVSRHLHPNMDPTATLARGRLINAFDVDGGDDVWNAHGSASYLEYDFANISPDAHTLVVPVSGPVEVWWSSANGSWTEGRRVRWWPSKTNAATDWAIPLDRLPHWDRSSVSRVRIAPRKRGPIAAGEPRLLR